MSKPPKYDHLRQMSGTTISESNRTTANRFPKRRNYSNHREIYPVAAQQIALMNLFTGELNLYNNFVKNMQARAKNMPEFYTELGGRQKELFIKMTRIRFDIRTISNRKSKRVDLPDLLEPYRDILFGISGDTEQGIDEALAIFYEVCSYKTNVLLATRENMAYEFLTYYVNQSSSFDKPLGLSDVNNMQKRHIQVSKRDIATKIIREEHEHGYDEHTEIKIPQLRTPILMKSNINDLPQWNLMIIHKDPSQLDLGRTYLHWEADFKLTDNRYLLNYLETPNPISKMKSRFIKR